MYYIFIYYFPILGCFLQIMDGHLHCYFSILWFNTLIIRSGNKVDIVEYIINCCISLFCPKLLR